MEIQDPVQVVRVDWLRQVVIHAGIQAALLIALQSMCRERNDADVLAGAFGRANFLCRLQTIELRHLHIHENDGEVSTGDSRYGTSAVRHDGHRMTPLAEESRQDQLIHRIILGHENVERQRREWRRRRNGIPGRGPGTREVVRQRRNGR